MTISEKRNVIDSLKKILNDKRSSVNQNMKKGMIDIINFYDKDLEKRIHKVLKESKNNNPRFVDYALVKDYLPNEMKRLLKNGKSRPIICNERFYTIKKLSIEMSLNPTMVYQRIRMGWSLVRAFGVENHSVDHYITKNLEFMKVI